MKNPVRHIAWPHQFIEASLGAGKHVIEIANRQHHAFGFSGSSGRVQNRDRIPSESAAAGGSALVADGGMALKISSNKTKRGAAWDSAEIASAKGRIAATNQARLGVAQHRGRARPRLGERTSKTAISPSAIIARSSAARADAVWSNKRASVSLCKSRSAQVGARACDLDEQIRACRGSIASRRASANTTRPAASCNCEKMFSRKFMVLSRRRLQPVGGCVEDLATWRHHPPQAEAYATRSPGELSDSSRSRSGSCAFIRVEQFLQIRTERRQIFFPAAHARPPHWKFQVLLMNRALQEYSHPGDRF